MDRGHRGDYRPSLVPSLDIPESPACRSLQEGRNEDTLCHFVADGAGGYQESPKARQDLVFRLGDTMVECFVDSLQWLLARLHSITGSPVDADGGEW